MKAEAVVIKTLDKDTAEIRIFRDTACGAHCESCGGCGAEKRFISATAVNTCGAKEGDKVLVETETSGVLGLAALVYILPIFSFFSGYFSAYAFSGLEHVRLISGAAGFAAGIFIVWLINGRIRKKGGPEVRIISVC